MLARLMLLLLTLASPPALVTPGTACDALWDTCGSIRPGSALASPFCTLGWIVEDEDGTLYAATAGHCLTPGLEVSDQGGRVIGTAVYARSDGVGLDFGLIRIDEALRSRVDPTLARWGGPVASAEDLGGTPAAPLLTYGAGRTWGEHEPLRGRVLVAVDGGAHVVLAGPAGPGDSGAPLMTSDGKAVGILTHGILVPGTGVPSGVAYGTWLAPALGWAGETLGRQFEVVRGSTLTPA